MSETGRFWTSKYFYRQTTQKIVSFSSFSKGTLFLFSFYYITRVPHVFSFSNLLDHLNRCCLLERRNRLIITRFTLLCIHWSAERIKCVGWGWRLLRKLSFSAGRVVEDIKIKRKEEGLINLPAATDGCALFFFCPPFFFFILGVFMWSIFILFCCLRPFLYSPISTYTVCTFL